MGATGRAVRLGRSGVVLAVTSSASPLGGAVVEALGAARIAGAPPRVVAVPDVAVPEGWTTDGGTAGSGLPALTDALAGADVVVHLAAPTDLAAELAMTATLRRARAVRAVQDVAAAAAAGGARRLVVVTGAAVYGAVPGNPVPLAEDAPLRAERDEGVVGDLLDVERIVARVPRVHAGLRCTVIRPAPLVGPGVDTFITRHFESSRLLGLRGQEMLWQFCHVDDLGTAVATAVEHDLDGVLTAGCVPWLTGEEMARLTGMRRTEVPPVLAFRTAERLARRGMLATPPGYLAYVVHPWVVGAQRLLEAGWRPAHSAQDCVEVLLAEARRRSAPVPDVARQGADGAAADPAAALGTPDLGADRPARHRDAAALGAAGAAVAVVAAAALLRQARSRRRPRAGRTI